MSISITALAAAALLLGSHASLETTNEALKQTIAQGMAQQLMDEIVGCRYMAVGADPQQVSLCPSSWEKATGTRERFDDIDDFVDIESEPPTDQYGVPLGTDDGEGDTRAPNFQVPTSMFNNWRQEARVYYVRESDLQTELPYGQTTDYRAVEVRIIEDIPGRGDRELARLRRIVTYVPSYAP